MPSHVALLRGVNLGNNRVAMKDLKALVEGLGYDEVATYVNSGNVVFTPARPRRKPATIAAELEEALAQRYAFAPPVVLLTRDELATVVAQNPWPEEPNPKWIHAIMHMVDVSDHSQHVVAATERAEAKAPGTRDEAVVRGRTVYLHTPDGFGRSVLATELTKQQPKDAPVGTARNWSSVTKLLALLDG